MPAMRCKVKVQSLAAGYGDGVAVKFVPVTAGDNENRAFNAETPNGSFETVLSKEAAEKLGAFTLGAEYYVEFLPVINSAAPAIALLLALLLPSIGLAGNWSQMDYQPAPEATQAAPPLTTPKTVEAPPHPDAGKRWLLAVGTTQAEFNRLRDLAAAHGFGAKRCLVTEELPAGVYQAKVTDQGKYEILVPEFDTTPPPKPVTKSQPAPPAGYRWECGPDGCRLVPTTPRTVTPVRNAVYQAPSYEPPPTYYAPPVTYQAPPTYYQPAPTYYAPPVTYYETGGSCGPGGCGSSSYSAGPSYYSGETGGSCGPGGCGSSSYSAGGSFSSRGLFGGFLRGGCSTCR